MRTFPYRHFCKVATLFLCAACHDAPRNNPFDPALTPAVEVQAALNDTAGVAALTWSRYQGQQPFTGYRVLRKVRGLEAVDTLVVITAPEVTSFMDNTLAPDLEYLYWVEVLNQAGFASASSQVTVRSFQVRGGELLEAHSDDHQGVMVLRWQRYQGPDFVRYEVWRRRFGEEGQALQVIAAISDTAWTDTSALPATDYTYWLKTLAAGKELESQRQDANYQLPALNLQEAVFSSASASAALSWTPYQGPRFAAYQVRRRAPGIPEAIATQIPDVNITAYLDTLLDGNTEYTYRLFVRTTWGEEIGVFSNERQGSFYTLTEVQPLPRGENSQIQALSLALDEQDRLYAAATQISTTTARVMQKGISTKFPTVLSYRTFFGDTVPDRLSPVQAVVGQGNLYLAVKTQEGPVMVGAVSAEQKLAWSALVETSGAIPVGLYAGEEGGVLMVDSQGLLHPFDDQGTPGELDAGLQASLDTDEALPLIHLAVGLGAGLGAGEIFFLLAPQREGQHIVGRVRTRLGSKRIFGGRFTFTDGVGPEDGETLSPLVLAFDASRTRLVVLEAQGRLQVFDARAEEVLRRYITKWGHFGRGEGEFQISPPTAVSIVVDSQGRIYVADGEGRVQVFSP